MRIVGHGVSKPKLIEYVESSSNPGVTYEVTIGSDNSVSCDCPALSKYECKHIKAVRKKYKIDKIND
jgi:hypothetical protein